MSPRDEFLDLGWDAPEQQALLDALCALGVSSAEWPKTLERSTPRETILRIYEACRAFSGGTLTVRTFDKWIEAWTKRNGGTPIKSAYHRLSGRLILESQHASVFLDCLFSRWGALPPGSAKIGMRHGWAGDGAAAGLRYFGLPVENPHIVRDRLIAELYPSTQPENDIGDINTTRLIVSRFNVVLGPPRGWALQAFHALASEKLARGSTVIFVIDLGRMRSADQRDFHAFFNLAELHTALMTLAIFDREVDPSEAFTLPAQRGRAAWTTGTRATPPATSTTGIWKDLKDRLAIAVTGLPDDFRREKQDAGKQVFLDEANDPALVDKVISEALKTGSGVSVDHIFPRVDLAHTLTAADLPDANFLSMNVWIEGAPGGHPSGSDQPDEIKVSHYFLWTLKDQRGRFGLDEEEEARHWWDEPGQYVGSTKRRPFADEWYETAFSMLQQAAAWRLGKAIAVDDREVGVKSFMYLSEKLNISMLTLDEFMTLPFELYRKNHPKNQD